jgi:hypothetical protein
MKDILLACLVSIIIFLLMSNTATAAPKTKVTYGKSLDGFSRVKIRNETSRDLACYIAIDGYKLKFRLPALRQSKWYTATDKAFSYRNFSTWCDYIDLHPEYKKYNDF